MLPLAIDAALGMPLAIRWFSGGLMDPFRLALALGPLGAYLLVLAAINLSRRPWLTTGARDTTALLIALSGLVAVGPLELLMPQYLPRQVGISTAWLMWLGLYASGAALWVVLQAPRLVIYNLSIDELSPVLAEVAPAIDPEAHWAGETLLLPSLCVQLRVDHFPAMRNVTLAAVGQRQSPRGWRSLEAGLAQALAKTAVPVNPLGISLAAFGTAMLVLLTAKWVSDPQEVARSFRQMFLP
jgi:hypothetical protein